MPDLFDELRRLADEAAQKARPLPAPDLLRRGDRRRRRTLVQRSAGGVVVAGLLATGVLAATTGSAGPASTVRSGSVAGKAGSLTITVRYQQRPHERLAIRSVTVSGNCPHAVSDPLVTVVFGPNTAARATLARASFGIRVHPNRAGDFTGSLPAHDVLVLSQSDLTGREPVSAELPEQDHGALLVARTTLTPGHG